MFWFPPTHRPGVPPCSPWVEVNLRHIPPAPGKVLDLACGRGRHSLLFLHLGYEVIALDSNQGNLDQLRKRTPAEWQPRLRVVCADLESSSLLFEIVGIDACKFDVVLVVNYLHRPLLKELGGYLSPRGVLIYESWAVGNELLAVPRENSIPSERTLRRNELVEQALQWGEILASVHGPQEDYEGRSCCKQMICARLLEQSTDVALSAMLGASGRPMNDSFTSLQAFGSQEVHVNAEILAGSVVTFGVENFLSLLRDVPDESARDAHLRRMREALAQGGIAFGGTDVACCPRLWNAALVRRTQQHTGPLVTETVETPEEVSKYIVTAQLNTSSDFDERGEGWTIVVNQLQGSDLCLQSFRHRLFCLTGLGGGINGYATPAGAIGKPPHVDDHDVLVLQQHGSKVWFLLDPSMRELRQKVCLRPGDAMYLPRGIPHHARAADEPGREPSFHLAVALHRDPLSWASMLASLLTVRSRWDPELCCTAPSLVALQEVGERLASLLAFSPNWPGHWLRNLVGGKNYPLLMQALSEEDVTFCKGLLNDFTRQARSSARCMAEQIRKGMKNVSGDAVGTSRQKSMLQLAATAELNDLDQLANMNVDSLRPMVIDAFFLLKAQVMDRHFAENGCWLPDAKSSATHVATGNQASEASRVEQVWWKRAPAVVAAMLHKEPDKCGKNCKWVLRANGFRFEYPPSELHTVRFGLGVYTGSKLQPFRIRDIPVQENRGGNGTALPGNAVFETLVNAALILPSEPPCSF